MAVFCTVENGQSSHLHQWTTLCLRVMFGAYLFLSRCAKELTPQLSSFIPLYSMRRQCKTRWQPLRRFCLQTFRQAKERVLCTCV